MRRSLFTPLLCIAVGSVFFGALSLFSLARAQDVTQKPQVVDGDMDEDIDERMEDRDDDDLDDDVDESVDTPYSEDNQFGRIQITDALDGPTDEDGRYTLKTRGAFGKGVLFATASDSFALQLRARGQFQGFARFSDPGPDAAGFQIRRLRLLLAGHALGKRLSYYIQLGFSENDLEDDARVPLRDAFFTWHAGDGFNLRFGQMKVPFSRQRVTSSSRLQLVERAWLTNELNLDRDVGLQVYGFAVPNLLRYYLGLFAGNGRNRLNLDGGFLYVGRLELFATGEFNDSDERDPTRSNDFRLVVGGAAGYNMRAQRTRSTQGAFFEDASYDYLHLTGDIRMYWSGWSLTAEYLYRNGLREHGEATAVATADALQRNQHGFFAQTGFRFTEEWEAAVRAGHSWALGSGDSADLSEITGGLSWYASGHNFKLQANYTALLSEGLDEHIARVQTQVFF